MPSEQMDPVQPNDEKQSAILVSKTENFNIKS